MFRAQDEPLAEANHGSPSVDLSILWSDWSNKVLPMTLEQSGH